MGEKNRFSKPVAFNNKNEEDNLILKHVSRRNFSGYVKKLILADIRSREDAKRPNEAVKPVKMDEVKPDPVKEVIKKPEPAKETAADKMARMREQLKNQKPSNKPPGPMLLTNKSINN